LKINNIYFLKSCIKISEFPNYTYPEFAFLGRSNVGKSSLINMLTGRKQLVKTGSKPGVTKTINFFVLNDNRSIADLPGYGYSKLPEELRKKFLPLIKNYIKNRENLKLAFLLIDIRRIPDEFEHDIISYLITNRISVAITLTKCDKLSNNKRKNKINEISSALGLDKNTIFYSSTRTGEGKKELLRLILE